MNLDSTRPGAMVRVYSDMTEVATRLDILSLPIIGGKLRAEAVVTWVTANITAAVENSVCLMVRFLDFFDGYFMLSGWFPLP